MTRPYVQVVDYKRVPWVAQWSGEISKDPVVPCQFDDGVGIQYQDERPEDRVLDVLWMRTDVDRTGDPQFAQLNVYRQRDAMIHGLCQVCGLLAEGSWLIPFPEPVRSGPIHTAAPATCRDCVAVARRLCPQLQREPVRVGTRHMRVPGQDRPGGVWLDVKNYRLYGVWGDLVEVINGQVRHYKGEIPLADPRSKRNILGRQLVVELYDYRKVRE